jgi:hypothetical protein
MCLIYIHTQLHMQRSEGSLDITVTTKTKENIWVTIIYLFYILQEVSSVKTMSCTMESIYSLLSWDYVKKTYGEVEVYLHLGSI